MSEVGEQAFVAYEQGHVARITPVVAPAMLLEASSAAALVFAEPALIASPPFVVASALLGVIWASTFAVQVPLHTRLSERFDAAAHARLVRTNWLRTLAWTMRGLLIAAIAYDALQA
jgi:hypothetical protein